MLLSGLRAKCRYCWVALLAVAIAHTRTNAQCETDWLLGQPAPDLQGGSAPFVRAMLVRDPDGEGPAPSHLWVGGSFTSIDGVSSSTNRGLAYWDGNAWQYPPRNSWETVTALAEYNGQIVTGGFGQSGVNVFDGATWTRLVGIGTSSSITALEVHGGHLYVAGNFPDISSVPNTQGIARWDGTSWAALGTGLSPGGIVTALKSTPQGLVIVGNFSTAGGTPVQDSARWDGTFWHVMNGLPGGSVWPLSLATHEGSLYAGMGMNPAGVVWNWNGSAWVSLAPTTQLSGNVSALHSFGGSLFAMGGPMSVDGAPATENVARWDGSTWSRCNDPHLPFSTSGTSGPASMGPAVTFGNSMVVGGQPTISAGPRRFTSLVVWNEAEGWSTFAKGLDGVVMHFLEYQGSWYICGGFRMAGGKACHGIARHDGLTFRPLGTRLLSQGSNSTWVRQLAEFQGSLYACGSNLSVGTDVARWNGSEWTQATGSSGSPTWDAISMASVGDSLFVSYLRYIQRFDGSAWTYVSTDATMNVDILVPHEGQMYAGRQRGGLRRWIHGTQWDVIPTGPTGIRQLLSHEGKLFALGTNPGFGGTVPGPLTSPAAEVRGTSFVPVGGGGVWDMSHYFPNYVFYYGGLTFYHGSLFATQGYYQSNPVPAHFGGVIRFDGLEWEALSPVTVSDGVLQRAMVAKVHGDTLWLGGDFAQMNGQPSPYIARYRSSPAPTFATTPTASTIRAGRSAAFSATPATTTTVRQRWRRNGVPLVEGAALPGGGVALGVESGTLVISVAGALDSGEIDCLITNACGTTITPAVPLVVHCTADFDDDGDTSEANPDSAVTIDDLLFFLVSFEAGDVAVDVDNGTYTGAPDQAVTIDDLLYFLAHFEAGC